MDRSKFRVWNNEIRRYEKLCLVDVSSEDGQFRVLPLRKTGVIEQCTGLKDRNGKLIYEGDIFRRYYGDDGEYVDYTVIWKDGGFGFVIARDFVAFAGHSRLDEILANSEVIGNIHEGVK